MKALIQRVSHASVRVDNEIIGAIEQGLLVLLGVERGDDESKVKRMADKLCAYRVFSDADGKMNLSVDAIGGGLLIVSQFTIAADTRKGLRPSFTSAAEPTLAESLYEQVVEAARQKGVQVETGKFAADMKVELLNDGPVTFLLEV